MKNSAYKFWSAVEKALGVVQWALLALIIPVIAISGLMQETGWNPEWAPAFLGRDGGGIIGCIMLLDAAFIVWLAKLAADQKAVEAWWRAYKDRL